MKTVSFVIISIGSSQYLMKMIQDITMEGFQVILVDNSKAGILNNTYDNNLVTYVHEERKGASYSRNRGATLVNSDYIYFLDDDLTLLKGWNKTLREFLLSDTNDDCVGGRVIAEFNKEIDLPNKYLYLVGEKNLGTKRRVLKHEYVGGCNLLINTAIFHKVGGFNTEFGHANGEIGLNEDALLLDVIRQNGGKVVYDPSLCFEHHWRGDMNDIIKRVQLQGRFDRLMDMQFNTKRFILRLFKYIVVLSIYKVKVQFLELNLCEKYDYKRYREYVKARYY